MSRTRRRNPWRDDYSCQGWCCGKHGAIRQARRADRHQARAVLLAGDEPASRRRYVW